MEKMKSYGSMGEALKDRADKSDRKKRLAKYQKVASKLSEKPENVGQGVASAMKTVAKVMAEKKDAKQKDRKKVKAGISEAKKLDAAKKLSITA